VDTRALHDPFNLSISKIGPESEVVLRNLFQYYIHDMAEWFDIDTSADGSYSCDTASLWEHGYDAWLARVGDSIAGFALVGSAAEWAGDIGAHDVREFFVIRRFRRSGFGQRMATIIWNDFPGEWLVRVLELNLPAVLFWRTAISTYSRGSCQEEVRIVDGRPWRFFRFVSQSGMAPPVTKSELQPH
jgi:predicted acetyltransferase